jgi:phosphate uptake regulator
MNEPIVMGDVSPVEGMESPSSSRRDEDWSFRRQLRRGGRSEIVMALPKPWAMAHGLDVGQEVTLWPVRGGGLLVTGAKGFQLPQSLHIEVKPGEPPEHTFRRLVGGYLSGATELTVSAPKGFNAETRRIIKEFRRRTSKLEVVSEIPTDQILQDIEAGDHLGIPQLVRRMFQLTLDMQREAGASWSRSAESAPRAMATVDDEVDKVAWRVQRTFVRSLHLQPTTSGALPSAAEAVYFLLIARALERISDHAVRLAEEGARLAAAAPPDSVLRALSDAHRQVLEVLGGALTLVEHPDSVRANDVIDMAEMVCTGRSTLMERFLVPRNGVPLSPLILAPAILILESIDRTASYAADIAEVVIDRESFKLITGELPAKAASPLSLHSAKVEKKTKEKR